MKKLIYILAGAMCLASCSVKTVEADYNVVPRPNSITSNAGKDGMVIGKETVILYENGDEQMKRNAEFLSEYIAESTGYKLEVLGISEEDEFGQNTIKLAYDSSIENAEGYEIYVEDGCAYIYGSTAQGMFYGVQTLRKSLPAVAKGCNVHLPAVRIEDAPRFGYRGMHLDVCRHFFSVDFVKEYIDLLALHNINTFHWHLTEDQGWRIQSEKYPKLTEIGAYRDSTVKGYAGTKEFEHERYGGYYTKDELREVVAYAAERYINIIPEIDMPGHMLAALASYPEFGCTGGPYGVCPDWGIFPDVLCVGNEDTMKFLEDIFEELIEIFPSKYIHIGGDEVPRERWSECPKCQARIKAEGLQAKGSLSAEARLQNYCTNRIERFLNAHGRQIIGWDEILEGDLNPEAIVMSGNSYEGGVKAARLNHKVVMAPNTSYYFDYYQTADIEDEPLAIGGCITVEKVYNSDPTSELTEEQAANVWGIQANMWTEYVKTPEHVEYMVLPRMAALCEVQWCPKGEKDYEDFTGRLVKMLDIYDRDGRNYGKHIYDIKSEFKVDEEAQALVVTLKTIDDAPIYYTLDGKEPSAHSAKYEGPIELKESADFKAVAIRLSGKSKLVEKSINFNKASLKPVTLTACQPYPNYTFAGATELVDGICGNENHATGDWLGFVGGNFEAVVDLQEVTKIHRAGATALTYLDAWIMAPVNVSVEVSVDGENYEEVASQYYPVETDPKKHCIVDYSMEFTPVEARFVKVVMVPSPCLPKGHAAAGAAAFLFIDEIYID